MSLNISESDALHKKSNGHYSENIIIYLIQFSFAATNLFCFFWFYLVGYLHDDGANGAGIGYGFMLYFGVLFSFLVFFIGLLSVIIWTKINRRAFIPLSVRERWYLGLLFLTGHLVALIWLDLPRVLLPFVFMVSIGLFSSQLVLKWYRSRNGTLYLPILFLVILFSVGYVFIPTAFLWSLDASNVVPLPVSFGCFLVSTAFSSSYIFQKWYRITSVSLKTRQSSHFFILFRLVL